MRPGTVATARPQPLRVLDQSVRDARKEARSMEAQSKQAAVMRSSETLPSTLMQTVSDVQHVSPALERYRRATLFGDLWTRPDLSPRDRSIVTLAVLIARGQTVELPAYLDLALDHGVTPG